MGIFEDKVKAAIKVCYGSVPKMSQYTGIPATTIYHALERGLDNTTTKTRNMILDSLKIDDSDVLRPNSNLVSLSDYEKELIMLWRELPENAQRAILANMSTYLEG